MADAASATVGPVQRSMMAVKAAELLIADGKLQAPSSHYCSLSL